MLNLNTSSSLMLHLMGWTIGFSACSAEAPPNAAPTSILGPVVYGNDDRIEWFEVADPSLRSLLADSVAAMIPWSLIETGEDGSLTLHDDIALGPYRQLCASERFREQPTNASCSGTLIAPNLLLTAGHCVEDARDCAGNAWVFDYRFTGPGERAPVTGDMIYRCKARLVAPGLGLPGDIDLAILQLDRDVLGRAPARVARDPAPAAGDSLVMAGFPSGIPMKVDLGARITGARPTTRDYFVASLDSFHGNSGSMVLNEHHEIIGVLTSGLDDYESVGSCSIVSVADPNRAREHAMYAFRAVNALCDRAFPEPALCPEAPASTCGDGFCLASETAASCAEDCTGLFAVPAAWSCNPAYFGSRDGCDCDCGSLDPDCAAGQRVYGCAGNSSCLPNGRCQTPVPEAWSCPTSTYGDGRRCDCNCGAPDPDCEDPARSVRGCPTGSACTPEGVCEIPLPSAWVCDITQFAGGNACDCDCGAWDPDCDLPGQRLRGCAPGSACQADGRCEVSVPASWVCAKALFGDRSVCDCNCGAFDPDCAEPSLAVRNCGSGQICNVTGECEQRRVEPGADVSGDTTTSDATASDTTTSDATLPGFDTAPPERDAPGSAAPDTHPTDISGDSVPLPEWVAHGGGGCSGGQALPLLWGLLAVIRRKRL